MKKYRIVFIVNGLSPYRLDFFTELGRQCRLTVLCEQKKARNRSWTISGSGSRTFDLIVLNGAATGADTALCPGVIKHLSPKKYDLIVVADYNTPTGILAITFLKWKGIPFALECDGGIRKSGRGLKEKMKKQLISQAAFWFSPGPAADRYLLHYGARKERIYHYPFTSLFRKEILSMPLCPEEKKSIRKEWVGEWEKMVLAAGRFIPCKNYDVLIQAWSRMDPSCLLVLAGGGEEKEAYEAIINRYRLTNVMLLDFLPREQLETYYEMADVFVHPTGMDVWGLVINEAMARGLPVITTNRCVAGIQLLSRDCIVPVKDEVTLAKKMNMILLDDKYAGELSRQNLRRIRAYTIEKMAETHMEAIHKILEKKHCTHYLYVYGNCSDEKYEHLFRDSHQMISQQAQKYHSLLIQGFSMNDVSVTCVSGLPINRCLTRKLGIPGETERHGRIRYYYLGFINLPLFRQICLCFASRKKTNEILEKENESIVLCDVLCISNTLGALFAAKRKGRKAYGIVTDVPGFLTEKKGFLRCIINGINWFLLSRYDGYIFLTEEMNRLINKKQKPYLVSEGHVDINMCKREPIGEEKTGKTIVLYAGSIKEIYGIKMLTAAFLRAGIKDCELHIYGDGDYAGELAFLCKKHPQIYYGGVRTNKFIVEQEIQAALLVNPRPTREEYTKYSFPSKNMEYMVSGTPLLTTRLPGMPAEYEEYVYLLEEETVEGLERALKEILARPWAERHEKGQRAKSFVLKEKNNRIQAHKIINFIENAE